MTNADSMSVATEDGDGPVESYVAITDGTGTLQVRHYGGPQANLYQCSPMIDGTWIETNVASRGEWWGGRDQLPNREQVEDFAAELFADQYQAQRLGDAGPFDG